MTPNRELTIDALACVSAGCFVVGCFGTGVGMAWGMPLIVLAAMAWGCAAIADQTGN